MYPHPGVVLVDTEGNVVLKRAEEKYSDRPSMDDLLEDVKEFVEGDSSERRRRCGGGKLRGIVNRS